MFNVKGGCAYIDCKGMDLLADSTQTIAGLFNQCKAAIDNKKEMVAVNCVYGEGVPLTPIRVFAIEQGGSYCMSASILQVWVNSSDEVTVVPLINTSKGAKK